MTTKLSELNLLDVGHGIQLAGAVYVGNGHAYLVPFPEEGALDVAADQADYRVTLDYADGDQVPIEVLSMDSDEWAQFLRQTDLLETEVLTKAPDGTLIKAILRKSQRQIESGVSWDVYRRDGYACRYCANATVPLTVDHLVLWEDGGPSTPANLVSACRKCNKTRGNIQYGDWLRHPFYLKVSQKLDEMGRQANLRLVETLDQIPRTPHQRSR